MLYFQHHMIIDLFKIETVTFTTFYNPSENTLVVYPLNIIILNSYLCQPSKVIEGGFNYISEPQLHCLVKTHLGHFKKSMTNKIMSLEKNQSQIKLRHLKKSITNKFVSPKIPMTHTITSLQEINNRYNYVTSKNQ